MVLKTGDFAATVWGRAVGSSLHLHLAEAVGVVDDGAALAALHLHEATGR